MVSTQKKNGNQDLIYQLLTDRFASTDDKVKECVDLKISYCGGTFKGIIQHLDYIAGMGSNEYVYQFL